MEYEEFIDEEVLLLDENGEEARFSHILTFLYEGERYAVLEPIEEGEEFDADEAEAEVVIMQIQRGGDEDTYLPVQNEVLLDELFGRFLELMDEITEEDE